MVGTASPNGSRILIVDDAEEDRRFLARRLQRIGYAVEQAENGFEAMMLVKRTAPDVVITDMVMPGFGGLPFLRALCKADSDLPVIVLAERAALDSVVAAMQEGLLFHCLLKPLHDVGLLEAALQRALEFQGLCLKARQADRIVDMAMAANGRILDLLDVLEECLTALTDERIPPEARTKVAATIAEALDTTARIVHEVDFGGVMVGERKSPQKVSAMLSRAQAS